MTTNNCCEKIECIPPRILSKEATNEIFGENLCLLIAVGKDGEAVRFLPYGVEETPIVFNDNDEVITSLLEISIIVPKEPDTTNVDSLVMDTNSSKKDLSAVALCICKQAGKPPRTC